MQDAGLQGKLAVAAPQLVDPNFWRAVVLICEHTAGGAIGLILNRPSDAPVADHLPHWTESLAEPAVVFAGGPVNTEVAVGLASIVPGSEVPGWSSILDEIGLLDLSQEAAASGVTQLRVFSGYAGWAGGQLEGEIALGDWFVVPGQAEDEFSPDAANLWHDVLARQQDRLALFANFPPDPGLN